MGFSGDDRHKLDREIRGRDQYLDRLPELLDLWLPEISRLWSEPGHRPAASA